MQPDELLDDARAGIQDAGDCDIALRHTADLPACRQVGAGSLSLSLSHREAPGNIGHGMAIPHGRSQHLQPPRAVQLRRATPVDSSAGGGRAIVLLSVLSVLAHYVQQHLMLLAELAELFSEPDVRTGLRAAADADALLARMRTWRPAPVTGTGDNALPSLSFPADPA